MQDPRVPLLVLSPPLTRPRQLHALVAHAAEVIDVIHHQQQLTLWLLHPVLLLERPFHLLQQLLPARLRPSSRQPGA